MASFLDNCAFVAAAAGTGSFTVANALNGAQTPAAAGAVDGVTYRYHAQSADLTQWEFGDCVSASSGTVFSRTIRGNSNFDANPISFATPPTVLITFISADIFSGNYADLAGKPTLGSAAAGTLGTAAGNVVQLDGSARLPAVDGSQLTGIAPFASGTSMLFYQTSAPTGWTKYTGLNDFALRLVNGTQTSGGAYGFSQVFSRTATDAFTIDVNYTGSHAHADYYQYLPVVNSPVGFVYNEDPYNPIGQGYTANEAGGYTTGGYAGNQYAHAHGMDIRILYADVIVATKN